MAWGGGQIVDKEKEAETEKDKNREEARVDVEEVEGKRREASTRGVRTALCGMEETMGGFPAPEPEMTAGRPYHISGRKRRRSLSEWRCQSWRPGLGAHWAQEGSHAAGRAEALLESSESPHRLRSCAAAARLQTAAGLRCLGLPWKALVGQKGRTEHLFSVNVMKTHTFLFYPLFSRVSKDKVSEVLLPRVEALLFYLLTDLVQVIMPLNFTVSPPISSLPNWDV